VLRLHPAEVVLQTIVAPTATEWDRAVVLIALGLTMAGLLLITGLLIERRQRIHAETALHAQVAFDHLISDLTDDLAFHESSITSASVESALARIGRYVGADAVALTMRAAYSVEEPARLSWTREERDGGDRGAPPPSLVATGGASPGARVAFPLFAGGVDVGTLELSARTQPPWWPGPLASQVQAAAEIVASALAASRAARAARLTEELNHVVLASLSTQLAIVDHHGVIVRVNEAWREVAERGGVTEARDAFVGTSYLEECRRAARRGAAEAELVGRGIEGVLSGRAQAFRLEYRCAPPDELWYELVVDRLEREEGGAVVMHLDITSRRLAERRAEEGRRQVEHLGRVAAAGELAAALSHELRQPLSAIRSNAQAGIRLLASDARVRTELREILDDIVADDARAATVIDRVRSLLRNEPPRSEPIDLNEVCRSVGDLLRADAALRDARLELELDDALPAVRGDPIQLQQVLLNLLLNALEASSSSGRRPLVIVQTGMRDGVIELSVRDSGPGILPDAEPHIFESFFSTKEHGLGMGLAIVRSIVERHRGRVRAENVHGGGAIFRVTLPPERVATPVMAEG
jgi:C4-dicarboxylate-specific signal transduction histidine kinase